VTEWVGDSNSTSTVSFVRGQGPIGGTTCGSDERLVSAPARCCPRFAFRLRTQHGPSGVPVLSGCSASGAAVLWRPLRTARFRWHVDQMWTRPPARVGFPVPSVADAPGAPVLRDKSTVRTTGRSSSDDMAAVRLSYPATVHGGMGSAL
jgi:hypothetical protein